MKKNWYCGKKIRNNLHSHHEKCHESNIHVWEWKVKNCKGLCINLINEMGRKSKMPKNVCKMVCRPIKESAALIDQAIEKYQYV